MHSEGAPDRDLQRQIVEPWALIILALGVAIAAVMLWREADRAFTLVIVWAYDKAQWVLSRDPLECRPRPT